MFLAQTSEIIKSISRAAIKRSKIITENSGSRKSEALNQGWYYVGPSINFQSLEVVYRGSETQLQVTENLNLRRYDGPPST